MTPQEVTVWTEILSRYRLDDVGLGMRRFVQWANHEAARGVVLGDLTCIIEAIGAKRRSDERQRQEEEEHKRLETMRRGGECLNLADVLRDWVKQQEAKGE